MTSAEPTQSELQDLFEDAGNTIQWKISKGAAKVGTKVMSMNGNGYLQVQLNGRKLMVHRVLFIMRHGAIPPDMQIDHINGDKLDNSFGNLRVATHAQNNMNQRLSRNNSSGVKGVIWHKSEGRWCAQLMKDGKRVHIGLFEDIGEAEFAVREARAKLHGEFANHGTAA